MPFVANNIIFEETFAMKQLLVLFLTALLFNSCKHITGSGNIVSEKRNTGGFTGIKTSSGIDVELKMGEPTELVIEADDNILKYVETDVREGILRIRFEDGLSMSSTHVKVYVTAPAITILNASSGASIIVQDELKSNEKLSLAVSSSGKIVADVDAPEVKANASSGSTLEISGRTRDYNADASSGASIKSGGLLSERTIAKASSGADITVHASISLEARASSGADIRYRGGANVQKTVSSGGSVLKVN